MARVIKREELKRLIEEGEPLVLLNVLDRNVYDSEHICGSINIPVEQIEAEAPSSIKKDETVVVYCGGPSCTASAAAVDRLEGMGYFNVRRYKGGLQEWKEAGYCISGAAIEEKAA